MPTHFVDFVNGYPGDLAKYQKCALCEFFYQPADCTVGWVIDTGDVACFDLLNCGFAKLGAANRVAVAITPRVLRYIKKLFF